MGLRRTPFAIDEWYHCYNRGIDKRTIFEADADAERFLQLLYLCNSVEKVHRSNLAVKTTKEVMALSRKNPIVSIGAYCLMPNHYHLVIKEITEGGITQFMQKLGTAYTMYFNKKYERTGNLLTKPFRSRHIGEDRYFQRVVDYVHCNPAERIESGWKKGTVQDMDRLERKLLNYRYSSFADFTADAKRDIANIISSDTFNVYRSVSPKRMLADARAYYADIALDDPSSL